MKEPGMMRMRKRFTAIAILIPWLMILNAQEQPMWKYQTGGRVYSTPLVSEEMVYAGSGDSCFYALEKASGKLRWKYETGGAVHSSPCLYNHLLYFGSADGTLYALDSRNGVLAWEFPSGGEKSYGLWDYYLSSPVVEAGIVYWGSGDGHLYALDWETGQMVWKYRTGDVVHASPVVKNGRVYVGSFDGFFYALGAENGALKWKFNTVGAQYFPKGEIQKAALVEDDVLYFGSRDYNIYALDAETGRGRWNMRQVRGWIIATPAEHEGKLYFGTSDAHLFYCMDKGNGEILWTIPVPMRVYGSAAVHGGVVYFGCFDGKVYGADQLTGEIKWEFQVEASKAGYDKIYDREGGFREDFELYGPDYLESENKILALGSVLSSIVIQEDILYFGSSDGHIYAVPLP